MANQYDTNLKLQAIADAIGDSSSSGLISALEDIADAVAGGGGGGSSAAGLVSDNFSETDTYDLGDYCIHNNTLYVCINAITTPGSWDLSDWQATNAGLELSSIHSALTAKDFGTTVTLTDNVEYVPTNDGYVCIGNTNTTVDVQGEIYVNNSLFCKISADRTNVGSRMESLFVRKGMRVKVRLYTNCNASFSPLV